MVTTNELIMSSYLLDTTLGNHSRLHRAPFYGSWWLTRDPEVVPPGSKRSLRQMAPGDTTVGSAP